MLTQCRRFLIRALMPLSWRRGDRAKAATLSRFARIEADSGWQFMRAVDVLTEPEERARMFLNAMEEHHHSALFARLADQYTERPVASVPEKRRALLQDPDELGDFLAYIHCGEKDIYDEFEVYAQASGDERVASLFRGIRDDEEGHQDSAHDMLSQVMGSEEAVDLGLRRARRRRMWHAWKHLSEQSGEGIAGALLSVVYWLGAPLLGWAAARRLRAHAPRSESVELAAVAAAK